MSMEKSKNGTWYTKNGTWYIKSTSLFCYLCPNERRINQCFEVHFSKKYRYIRKKAQKQF